MDAPLKKPAGFTLAELLIDLAILGVIATFTIPKVLNSQQGNASNAAAKEIAAMAVNALQVYKQNNTITPTTSCGDLTPYFNYVRVDSTTRMDDLNTLSFNDCTAADTCLRMHNGATLMFCHNGNRFGGTQNTSAIFLQVDPDSKYLGTTTGASKSILFWLYPNGRIVSIGDTLPGTYYDGNPQGPWPAGDPDWFSWD